MSSTVSPTDVDAHLANVVAALALGLADRIRSQTEAVAKHTAAGPAALVALHEFLEAPTIDQLRDVLGLTPSGTVRLVDRLAADGYVERRPGKDARSVSLALTAKGRRAAVRILEARAEAVATPLAALSAPERQALGHLTDKLVASLTEQRLADRQRGSPPAGGWLCRLCDLDACGRGEGECPAANAAALYREGVAATGPT